MKLVLSHKLYQGDVRFEGTTLAGRLDNSDRSGHLVVSADVRDWHVTGAPAGMGDLDPQSFRDVANSILRRPDEIILNFGSFDLTVRFRDGVKTVAFRSQTHAEMTFDAPELLRDLTDAVRAVSD
ncbi:hypothetical protein [Paractinoplanes lichenicola]|uniref:Uncharacterized protein n=1 Tax=Paractinoplanes lichenicola TaxID=2802976 RepID=A0ABS1VMF8_9ACTN|nr:hypothetical protein [Actinoplanes lichenicola]MBL7255829.1 hypothetical protein [Actinoplanes lichenicola]